VVVAVLLLALLGLRRRLRRPHIADWRDAEDAAAQWLHKAGCREVSLTGASADGGIDVITADWAVQVKHTNRYQAFWIVDTSPCSDASSYAKNDKG
jgi:hypothetical protein